VWSNVLVVRKKNALWSRSTDGGTAAPIWYANVDGMNHDTYHGGMQATVGERGQVTIPKELRDRMGIRPGQQVEFTEEADGRIVIRKRAMDDAVARVYGTLPVPGWDTDGMIDAMRGAAEPPPER
jgi:AbrB family looped-hinge helix DNA binding protein